MSSETISGPWTVVDITDTPEGHPVNARRDLVETLKAWSVRHDLPTGDILIGTDDEVRVSVTLDLLTLNREGDIEPRIREYLVTAHYAVEVQVTVEAASEHEAQQEARDLLYGLELEPSWGEGTVTDTVFERIEDIEEQ